MESKLLMRIKLQNSICQIHPDHQVELSFVTSRSKSRQMELRRNRRMIDTRELEEKFKEQFPSHNEIEKRAYELYLERGEDGDAERNWLVAEEELKEKSAEGIPFLRLV